LYPIELDEYPKLFDYVLTKQDLIYFHTLKRNYLLGKNMSLDEYNKLRLMYVYYATANRNPPEVHAWQNVCIALDDKEIFEKDMYHSKEDLKNKSLIVKNPHYQSWLYRKYVQYVKEIIIQSSRYCVVISLTILIHRTGI
jgi:hypothetical protein